MFSLKVFFWCSCWLSVSQVFSWCSSSDEFGWFLFCWAGNKITICLVSATCTNFLTCTFFFTILLLVSNMGRTWKCCYVFFGQWSLGGKCQMMNNFYSLALMVHQVDTCMFSSAFIFTGNYFLQAQSIWLSTFFYCLIWCHLWWDKKWQEIDFNEIVCNQN